MTLDEFIQPMILGEGVHIAITDFNSDWTFEIWSPRFGDPWLLKYRLMGKNHRSFKQRFDTLESVIKFMENPKTPETLTQTVERLTAVLNRAVEKYPELKELLDE